MSFFRRRTFPEDIDTDDELNDAVDPELRLRTVRTAASTLAESIRTEQRVERRKSMRKKGSRFFRRGTEKRRTDTAESGTPAAAAQIPGARRNIYVNYTLPLDEVDHNGDPIVRYVRNKVRTSSECRVTSLSSLEPGLIASQNIRSSPSCQGTFTSSFVGESNYYHARQPRISSQYVVSCALRTVLARRVSMVLLALRLC